MPSKPIWRALMMPALLPLLFCALAACSPKVIAAPPSPSAKPVLPPFLRQCPEPYSWTKQMCSAPLNGNLLGQSAGNGR